MSIRFHCSPAADADACFICYDYPLRVHITAYTDDQGHMRATVNVLRAWRPLGLGWDDEIDFRLSYRQARAIKQDAGNFTTDERRVNAVANGIWRTAQAKFAGRAHGEKIA